MSGRFCERPQQGVLDEGLQGLREEQYSEDGSNRELEAGVVDDSVAEKRTFGALSVRTVQGGHLASEERRGEHEGRHDPGPDG